MAQQPLATNPANFDPQDPCGRKEEPMPLCYMHTVVQQYTHNHIPHTHMHKITNKQINVINSF